VSSFASAERKVPAGVDPRPAKASLPRLYAGGLHPEIPTVVGLLCRAAALGAAA
jgi:hypothetical protein